jgi:hypothetical protein
VVKSITSNTYHAIDGMSYYPENKKIILKFGGLSPINSRRLALTIGVNGGFQWIGTHIMMAGKLEMFSKSNNMDTVEFKRCVASMKIGSNNKYIWGVPRCSRFIN